MATTEHWTEAADGHDHPAEDHLSHHLNEDADIPCRLVDMSPA